MASTSQVLLRHIFYVLAMAMCHLHQMGVACDTINGSLLSCHGECGNVRMVPCSCDVTCVVLNKCCEDFADHCPFVVTEAMERFSHLMNATVVCSKDSFFTIMSCPQEATENQQPFTQPDGNQSVSLLDLVNNAPVADLSTGFVYRNSQIYFCNEAEKSQMVHFEIEVEVISNDTPVSYLDLNRNLDLQNVAYTPSADVLPFVGRSACMMEDMVTMTCKDRTVNVTAETVNKCEFGSYSYVDFNNLLYKNKYCLFCTKGHVDNYTGVDKWRQLRHNFKLSVLPSLTNDGAVLHVVFNQNSKYPAAWAEVECDVQEIEQVPDSTLCDVQCGDDYQLRPDGRCLMLHDALIGFSDDGYGLNEGDKSRLPDLMSCFLQEHFDIDVVYTDPKTSFGCDDRLKRDIYFVSARLALVDSSFVIFSPKNAGENLVKFSTLVKAFLRHRMKKFLKQGHDCRVHTNSCYQDEDVDVASECRSIDENKSTFQRFTSKPIIYLKIWDQKIRGVIVDNTSTAVCISSQKDLLPSCWEDLLYKNDLNLMSEYMDSKCFAVFDEKNGANVYVVNIWILGIWLFCR